MYLAALVRIRMQVETRFLSRWRIRLFYRPKQRGALLLALTRKAPGEYGDELLRLAEGDAYGNAVAGPSIKGGRHPLWRYIRGHRSCSIPIAQASGRSASTRYSPPTTRAPAGTSAPGSTTQSRSLAPAPRRQPSPTTTGPCRSAPAPTWQPAPINTGGFTFTPSRSEP